MSGLTAKDIERIAKVLEANEGYDGSPIRISKLVVEVGSHRVTLSRRSKWASLCVSKIEEVRR